MRVTFALALVALVALATLSLPAASFAKGFTRVVLVGSDGRSIEVRAPESTIDGLLSSRGAVERFRGGYLRLFFVGPGDFPASPARYYPAGRCIALDWPAYETTCARIDATLVRLLRSSLTLRLFRVRPTVLASIAYHGTFRGPLKTAKGLKTPVELALDRTGRAAPVQHNCYVFTGRWRGPASALRPRRFKLCRAGIYAGGRAYTLQHFVWEWFQANVGPPPAG